MIDISLSLRQGMPFWPGSKGLRVTTIMSMKAGDQYNLSFLECDLHAGTHVDAPLHFIQGGNAVESLPLDVLIGRAYVADLSTVSTITAACLESLKLPTGIRRLLVRTRNSRYWQKGVKDFRLDYVALTADAARWIVNHNITLVGIDYLSIQSYYDGPETHLTLLEAGVVIVEGLNLYYVSPGEYELICLPLKLVGAEGAPARAVLRPLQGGEGQ